MKPNNLLKKLKSTARNVQIRITKLFHSLLSRHVQEDHSDEQPRITRTNLETYRQDIIQQGRRHIRPGESSRHNVVIYSIVIGVAALLACVIASGYMIYSQASKSSFIYNVTKIFPAPVAVIDGSRVMYNEVLFYYETAKTVEASLQQNQTEQSEDELYFSSLFKAVQNTYIKKLAARQGTTVTQEEIRAVVSNPEELAGGADKFEASVNQVYGWSRHELEEQVRIQLLTQKLLPEAVTDYLSQLNASKDPDPQAIAEELGLLVGEKSFVAVESLEKPGEGVPIEVAEALRALKELNEDQQEMTVRAQDGVYIVSSHTEAAGEYLFVSNEIRGQMIQRQLEEVSFYSCQSDVAEDAEDIETRSIWSCVFP